MRNIAAHLVGPVTGVIVADGGEHVVLTFQGVGDQPEFSLAVSIADLNNIMIAGSQAIDKASVMQSGDHSMKSVTPALHVEIGGGDAENRNVVFSFHLDGGIQRSYSIDREAASRIGTQLVSELGSTTADQSGKSLN